jgi:hypothetical protein
LEHSKELFIKALKLQKTHRLISAPHWWGIYKYASSGLDFRKDSYRPGDELFQVYADFYEEFQPDWFHMHIGTPRYFKNSMIEKRKDKYYLRIDPALRGLKNEDKYFSVHSPDDEEIVDFADYLLSSRAKKPKVDLSDQRKIDDYIKKYVHMDADHIIDMGYADHIKKIADIYGEEVFVAVHIPSAICEIFDPTTGYLGFEEGLMAFYDHPQNMKYFLEKCYEEQLNWPAAFSKAGAHGYIISESYISPDLANPKIYLDFMKDIHAWYFKEIEKMGLFPMCMFWGDVNPILEDLSEIHIKGFIGRREQKRFSS